VGGVTHYFTPPPPSTGKAKPVTPAVQSLENSKDGIVLPGPSIAERANQIPLEAAELKESLDKERTAWPLSFFLAKVTKEEEGDGASLKYSTRPLEKSVRSSSLPSRAVASDRPQERVTPSEKRQSDGASHTEAGLTSDVTVLAVTSKGDDDSSDRVMCKAVKRDNRVKPGSSWGSLNKAGQADWIRRKCDRFFCAAHVKAGRGTYKCNPLIAIEEHRRENDEEVSPLVSKTEEEGDTTKNRLRGHTTNKR